MENLAFARGLLIEPEITVLAYEVNDLEDIVDYPEALNNRSAREILLGFIAEKWQKELGLISGLPRPGKDWVQNRIDNHNRRAAARGNRASLTKRQWLALLVVYRDCCAYCGTPDDCLAMDHVVAIVNGGHSEISNIVPACQWCNSSKQATPVEQWIAEHKFALGFTEKRSAANKRLLALKFCTNEQ